MPYLNFNSAKASIKLAITIMSILTIGFVVWYTGFLISRIFFHISVPVANDLLHGNAGHLSVGQIKYYQILQTLGFFVLPGIFLQWMFSTPEKSYFNIKKKPYVPSLIIVAISLAVAIPFINYLIEYNQAIQFPDFLKNLETKLQNIEKSAESMTMQLLTAKGLDAYLVNILMIAILPAIGEEFIFRGVFQKIFFNISKNKHMAIILAAILFSAVHGQFFGFIPRFLLGVFFGYLLIWSKSIWVPVFAHFINNAIAVSLYYLYGKNALHHAPDKLGLNIFGGWGIGISVALCILGLFFIYSIESKKAVEN